MESNSTTDLNGVHEVSIINFGTFISVMEADFSAWTFYEDSQYESAILPAKALTKKIKGAKEGSPIGVGVR